MGSVSAVRADGHNAPSRMCEHPLGVDEPGSELFEGLLVVTAALSVAGAGQLAGGGAEAAGGAGGDDHGWDSEESTGATGFDAAEAIGSEKGRRMSAGRDAQQ